MIGFVFLALGVAVLADGSVGKEYFSPGNHIVFCHQRAVQEGS